jgi:ribosomal protein L2
VKSRKRFQNYGLTNSINQSTNSVQTAFSYILACNDLKAGDDVFNINSVSSDKWPLGELSKELQSNFSSIYPVEKLYEKNGISLPLWLAPLGSSIHNIELYPGEGGKLVRAAGARAQLVQKPLKLTIESQKGSAEEVRGEPALKGTSDVFSNPRPPKGALGAPAAEGSPRNPIQLPPTKNKSNREHNIGELVGNRAKDPYMCTIRLPSGQQQLLDLRCRATIGIVSNIDHNRRILKKAGQSRWLGFRPVVRGVAMNPIDHPHGGGEGRTKGGRPSVSPWGKPAKGHCSNPMAKRRATTRRRR